MSTRIVVELRNALCAALTGPLSSDTATPFHVASAMVAIAVDFGKISGVDVAHLLATYLVQVEPNEVRAVELLLRTAITSRRVDADTAIRAAKEICASAGRRGHDAA